MKSPYPILLFVLFTILTSTVNAEIIYKPTSDKINRATIAKLNDFLSGKTTAQSLLSPALATGPGLWQELVNQSLVTSDAGKRLHHIIPEHNLNIDYQGRIFQQSEPMVTALNHVREQLNQDGQFVIRHLSHGELNRYWGFIAYDIEEPIFVVESARRKFLFDLKKNQTLFYLDDYSNSTRITPQYDDTLLGHLRNQVNTVMRMRSEKQIRQFMPAIYSYIDALIATKAPDIEIETMLTYALKYVPGNMTYQLKLAEVKKRLNEIDQSIRLAALVRDGAEQQALRQDAEKMLNIVNKDQIKTLPAITNFPKNSILLINTGLSPNWLLRKTATDLAKRVPRQVFLYQQQRPMPKWSRTGRDVFMKKFREQIHRDLRNQRGLQMLLHQLGLTPKSLELEENCLKLIDAMHRGEPEKHRALQVQLENLAFSQYQWTAAQLAEAYSDLIEQATARDIKLVFITDLDLYLPKNNYLFFQSEVPKNYAVISTHRLMAAFYGDTPNPQRLNQRLTKMTLSSIMFLLDSQGCSRSRCPHSYPNSLEALDKKDLALCDRCNSNLKKMVPTD